TNSILLLTNVQSSDAGNYDVIVNNAYGSATNRVVILSVTPAAPRISFQPASEKPPQGVVFTFSVRAVGTLPMNYQWRLGGVPIAGGTNQNVRFPSAEVTNNGLYDVVLSNSVGSITSVTARLTVVPRPLPSTLSVWGNVGNIGSGARYYNGLSNV